MTAIYKTLLVSPCYTNIFLGSGEVIAVVNAHDLTLAEITCQPFHSRRRENLHTHWTELTDADMLLDAAEVPK